MRSQLVLDCLISAIFSYDPGQARTPAGQKGGGQWSSSGQSSHTGHDLWIIGGASRAATAAAASLTRAEGWDDDERSFGDWDKDLATSMLTKIHAEKVRTTKYYSGHTSRQPMQKGDIIDIPLMAITNSRGTASIYSDTGFYNKAQTAERRTAQANKKIEKALSNLRNGGHDTPEVTKAVREALMDMEAIKAGAKRPEHHVPATTFVFESNKSIPIRVNERVASGRYEVKSIERTPIPGAVLYDKATHQFVDSYSETVTLSFVEDLKIQGS